MIKSLRKFESLTCILVNFLFLGACTQNAEQGSVEPVVSLGEVPLTQLPADVRPLSYNLQLKINPDEDYFEGVAQIRIELDKPRDGIWLHGVDLDITEGSLHRQGSPAWELTPEQVNDAGVLRIDFPEALSAGLALLEFKYRARYNISDEGLSKVEEGGNAYVFSQLEATSARMVFPSFDEPRFKTAFDIKVDIAADHVAISNAPEKSVETVSNGWKRVTFATTRLLPTYLIALAVGPFDVVQAPDIRQSKIRQETIPLRGIAVKGKGDQLKFALAHTEELLLALEQYFDYPYPYAKLDLIAVPSKGSSAMENAGAITYGEQLLLLDDTATVEQTRGYYSVHAHELAHQWFGNLVTPRWWNDIWLNEAFATWIAAKILDRLYPGEHYLDDQAASTAAVMNQDGLVTARKIRQPILDHGDINAAFDGITYVKGGGVLRMFESFLGEDEFREGLRHYMDKHAWGNTDANDFMKAISEVNSHVDSAELISSFNSYIDQPGVPIVNVNLNCAEDRNNLAISQKRYFPVGSSGVTDQKWDIPICIKYRVDGVLKEVCQMVTEINQEIILDSETCPDYMVPNAGGNAYYRWNLPAEQWTSLLSDFESLDSNEQLSAASSLSAAFNAAELNLDEYLDAVALLSRAESGNVATAPIGDVLTIVQYLVEGDQLKALQRRLVEFYKPRLDALDKVQDKTPEQQQLYNFLLSIVSRYLGEETWRARLTDLATAYTGYESDNKLHPGVIDVNMRSNALRVASDDLGLPFVQHLWAIARASDDATLREVMIRAMAFSGDPKAGEFVRGLMLDPDLRPNELGYIGFHQTYYKSNRVALWAWMQGNYDAVIERIGKNSKGQIAGLFSSFCSEEKALEVDAFFAERVDNQDGSSRALASTLETIRLCSAFVAAHSQEMKDG